jgi:hypothetical protein
MKKGMYVILIFLVIVSITGVALAVKPENQPTDPLTALWNAVNALQTAVIGLQANDTVHDVSLSTLEANATAQEGQLKIIKAVDTTQQMQINSLARRPYRFGEWTLSDSHWNQLWMTGYTYPAASDGFLVINVVQPPATPSHQKLCAYTASGVWDSYAKKMCISLDTYGGMTIPVRGGESWEVDEEPDTPYVPVTIQWLPLTA